MLPYERKIEETSNSESDQRVSKEEKNLILLKNQSKKNVDQSISNSQKYTSWYHYNTKNVDKYIQLCPHCKKPTLSAFHRTVVDSATDYLNGKRLLASSKKSRGNYLQSFMIMLAFCSVIYFIVSRI